jgi:Na+/H+ antiporter NhaD/arsenite permease-like protein
VELTFHGYLTLGVFLAVVLVIALDLMHMTLAMLLGVTLLILSGAATEEVHAAGMISVLPIISLFIASMVLIRCLEPTRLFAFLAHSLYTRSRGDGRILLVTTLILTSLLCAILPNATVVLFLAPLLIGVARLFAMPPVPLVILLVLTANTAGLLTMVGGIPSFLIATALGMDFMTYLARIGPGAMLALGVLLLIAPLIFPTVWNFRSTPPIHTTNPPPVHVNRPAILAILLAILALTAILYGIGEYLPLPIPPMLTAVAAGTMALTVVHLSGLDDFERIIREIDWETIIFFYTVFLFIEAMQASGVFSAVGLALAPILGSNAVVTAVVVMITLGMLSCIMPNIPLTAVMIPTIGSYLVAMGFLEIGLQGQGLGIISRESAGIVIALLFGVTLGGNITLIGAVPNLIAAGACRKEGIALSFGAFLRYGLPAACLQIAVAIAYVLVIIF